MPQPIQSSSSLISIFRATINQISDYMEVMSEIVGDATVSCSTVYSLPTITKDDEKARMLAHRKYLNGDTDSFQEPRFAVTPINGVEAINDTLEHYRQICVNVDESSWYAKRLPGLICLQSNDAKQLLDVITSINTLKAELQMISKTIDPNNYERRWEIIHQAIPGFSSSAAFRPVLFVANEQLEVPKQPLRAHQGRKQKDGKFVSLYSARFNFEHRNQMRKVPYTDLIAKLERTIKTGDSQRPGLSIQAEQELRYIQNLSKDTLFVQKRPMPAVPIYKIRGEKSSQDNLVMENGVAHSPVLCINLDKPQYLGPLPDYPGRTLNISGEGGDLVIRRLHLYRR